MFHKDSAYQCTKNVPSQNPNATVPTVREGEVLLCIKGGKKPILSNGGVQISAAAEAMAHYFEETMISNLPDALRSAVSSNDNPPQVKKGSVYRVKVPVSFDTGAPLAAGALIRCIRGGKSSTFIMPGAESVYEEVHIKLPLSNLEEAEPVVSPGLERAKVRIKVFDSISEDTLAKAGTITIGPIKVDVQNSGYGASDMISGDIEGLESHLINSLVLDPATPFSSAEDVKAGLKTILQFFPLATLYTMYSLSAFWGTATFGEFAMRHKQQEGTSVAA